ncbi:MAG: CBS domain-containing protein [Planctomycetaceae bacterium]|jgi:CBS domain-containing protein|nr:CBS domain-containing protein [Planctomycetaceae bacterium]MBT6155217.1 CBS domain-containing protein [Planctomycetaceae bacterium]MBT6483267.1 CBS domain-containing protein [Planctomycetaceae bacterium]MBT6494594.1 CBS domain-containing protein [Planctomycetaceae bacterium]
MSKMTTAREVMRQDVITLSPDDTAGDAIRLLLNNSISGAPVVDNEGHIVGLVSEYELLQVVYDRLLATVPVSEFMTREVISYGPDTTIIEVAGMFMAARIRRIPIVEDGKLIGLLSRRDLLRTGLQAIPDEEPALTAAGHGV